MADRITAVILLVFAAFYGWGASQLRVGFGSDPLGPKVFPFILATILAVVAVAMVFRADPNPPWLTLRKWLNFMLVVASFIAYAYVIVPLGFLLSTALETGFVSERFGARWWQAILTGVLTSIALYVLFVYALGIPLPTGRIFGGR